jgi:hypothetical protein
VDRLAVGGGDDDEQGDDPDGDRERVPERDRADDRHGRHQHEKDLLGGVGDRGEGIGGEHGERRRLAQPLVLSILLWDRFAKEKVFEGTHACLLVDREV